MTMQKEVYFIPKKSHLPINFSITTEWYANLLKEVSDVGFLDSEIEILKDKRNYYGKYFDRKTRAFFLHHFARNTARTINYLSKSGVENIRYLEIGFGCGSQLMLMALLGAESIGCDIREDVCEIVLKRKCFYGEKTGRTLGISLICNNVFAVDWEKFGKFDTVNFLFSFNDIKPEQKMLELIINVLKPGGRVVIQETNPVHVYNRLFRRRDNLSPYVIKDMLKAHGFKIHSLRGGYALPPFFWRFLPTKIVSSIDNILNRIVFLSVSYQLMAEKA